MKPLVGLTTAALSRLSPPPSPVSSNGHPSPVSSNGHPSPVNSSGRVNKSFLIVSYQQDANGLSTNSLKQAPSSNDNPISLNSLSDDEDDITEFHDALESSTEHLKEEERKSEKNTTGICHNAAVQNAVQLYASGKLSKTEFEQVIKRDQIYQDTVGKDEELHPQENIMECENAAAFVVKNIDTGETFHIERSDDMVNTESYSLFPSQSELVEVSRLKPSHGVSNNEKPKTTFLPGIKRNPPQNNNFGVERSTSFLLRRFSMEKHDRICSTPLTAKTGQPLIYKTTCMIQSIQLHKGPVWVIEASLDGKYIATAGQDKAVYLWKLDPSALPNSTALSKTIIPDLPHRILQSHQGDVVSLTWSAKHYILSASLDKSVHLWHVDQSTSLAYFQHAECVTSVFFHPIYNWFISGCVDKRLRIWDIGLGRVRDFAYMNKPITAVSFANDGNTAAAGLANGDVFFFKVPGLQYYTQVSCKNKYGQYKSGRKVTGLQFIHDSKLLLVTTNDSRIRIFCMTNYDQLSKFKGNLNESMLIRANINPQGNQIICGSENGCIYIWKNEITSIKKGQKNVKVTNSSYEKFSAISSQPPIVSCALFLDDSVSCSFYPKSTRKLIVSSGYDGILRVFEADPTNKT